MTMKQEHKDLLIKHRPELVETLNMRDGLYTQLIQRKIITQRTVRTIQNKGTTDQQAEELLDTIVRCGPKAFDSFCEALIADAQEHIVTEFLRPAASQDSHEASFPGGNDQRSRSCDAQNRIQQEPSSFVRQGACMAGPSRVRDRSRSPVRDRYHHSNEDWCLRRNQAETTNENIQRQEDTFNRSLIPARSCSGYAPGREMRESGDMERPINFVFQGDQTMQRGGDGYAYFRKSHDRQEDRNHDMHLLHDLYSRSKGPPDYFQREKEKAAYYYPSQSQVPGFERHLFHKERDFMYVRKDPQAERKDSSDCFQTVGDRNDLRRMESSSSDDCSSRVKLKHYIVKGSEYDFRNSPPRNITGRQHENNNGWIYVNEAENYPSQGYLERLDSVDGQRKPPVTGGEDKLLRKGSTLILSDAQENVSHQSGSSPLLYVADSAVENFQPKIYVMDSMPSGRNENSTKPKMVDPSCDVSQGSLSVNVECCTRQFYLTHYKKSYAMRRIPRGKALIINVNAVEGKLPRKGTNIDRKNLKNLLTQLHFEVTVFNDEDGLTAFDIQDKCEQFSALPEHVHADACVVCLLSHGEEGYLFGTDGKKIHLDSIFTMFDNKRCPSLMGKPKMFIVQACRGGAFDSGVIFHDEVDGSHPSRRQLPTMSDMLICYPTQSGYYAWRNRERGSWYIEALVQVFMKYAKDEDVCVMLNRVNELVSRKVSQCPHVEMDRMSQMSEYKSSLREPHLFFFPGIGSAF